MSGFYVEFHYLHYILAITTWPCPPLPGFTVRCGPTWYRVDEAACADPDPGPGVDIPFVCTCLPLGLGALASALAGDPDPARWPDERVTLLDRVLHAGDTGLSAYMVTRHQGNLDQYVGISAMLWLEQARLTLRVIRAEDRTVRWVTHPDMQAGLRDRVMDRAQALRVTRTQHDMVG